MTAPYLRGSGSVNAPGGHDAAVVLLGCVVGERGELPGTCLARVRRAAEVAREREELLVVVSGGRRWGDVAEATAMARGLVAEGVAAERIVLELLSFTTRENARYSARLLRERGIGRVVLVTSDFHLRRARFCFEAEGLEVEAVAAPTPRSALRREVYLRVREQVAFLLDRLR